MFAKTQANLLKALTNINDGCIHRASNSWKINGTSHDTILDVDDIDES